MPVVFFLRGFCLSSGAVLLLGIGLGIKSIILYSLIPAVLTGCALFLIGVDACAGSLMIRDAMVGTRVVSARPFRGKRIAGALLLAFFGSVFHSVLYSLYF